MLCIKFRRSLKRESTHAENRFRLSGKRTSPFKSVGVGRQFSRLLAAEVCGISGSNAGYIMFRGSVKGTGYPLHSPVYSSLPLPFVTVCHHISIGLFNSISHHHTTLIKSQAIWFKDLTDFCHWCKFYGISYDIEFNPLTSNDPYKGRTAPLTSKRFILCICSTNIGTEYFKHGIYSSFFSLQNAVCFIILTYLVPVLFTFYIHIL